MDFATWNIFELSMIDKKLVGPFASSIYGFSIVLQISCDEISETSLKIKHLYIFIV